MNYQALSYMFFGAVCGSGFYALISIYLERQLPIYYFLMIGLFLYTTYKSKENKEI